MATAVQRYRADPDRRAFENKLRILRGIAEGAVPRPRSLEKYDIGVDEVDAIRARNQLPRLFSGDGALATTTATLLEINQMTRERMVERAKGKMLLENIEEDTLEYNRMTRQVRDDFRDKIVEIPRGEAFSVKTVCFYFQKIGGYYEQFPSGTGRNVTKRKLSESTVRTRWGVYGKYESSLCGKLFRDTPFINDIREPLSPENIRQFLEDIPVRMPGVSATNSILAFVNVTGLILLEYPELKNDTRYDASRRIVSEMRATLKTRSDAEQLTKVRDEELAFTFREIEEKAKGDRDFSMYLKIFRAFPSRDDFGGVKIVSEKEDKPGEESRVNAGANYLIVPTDRREPVEFVLVSYKTKTKYGTIRHKFDGLLSREIRGFVANKTYLFGATKRLSQWVSNKLKKIGVKTEGDGGKSAGAINLLRHTLITEIYNDNPNLTSEQRTEVAEQFKHSPGTAQQYVRSFAEKREATMGLPGTAPKKRKTK